MKLFCHPVPDHRRARSTVALVMFLGSLLGVLGCAGGGNSGKSAPAPAYGGSRIDELNLVTMPVAVNVDSRPGAEGIALKVYAADSRRPKTQPLKAGTLELLLFDGLIRNGFDQTNRCLRVWSFPAAELAPHAFTSTVGTGYAFTLGWGNARPRSDQVTAIARYLPPQGRLVYSAPSYLALPMSVSPSH